MANNTPLVGYPQQAGAKWEEVFDHTGPASYSNIGTSSGTGDIIRASDFGFGGIEMIQGGNGGFLEGYTNSGNFIVKIFVSSSGTTPALGLPPGGAVPQMVLQWFTTSAAFGAISTEVTNTTSLAAESVRLYARLV